MQQTPKTSALGRAISGFANTAAAIGALFLVPYVAHHFRVPVYDYIYLSMPHAWAYWGSWLFVALTAMGCYFGSSTLLQAVIQLLFRGGGNSYRGGF